MSAVLFYVGKDWLSLSDMSRCPEGASLWPTTSLHSEVKDRHYPIGEPEVALLTKLKAVHDEYYPDSPFLFPANTANGCITCKAVEDYHRRLCKRLEIPISKDCRRGPHAFRRTRITEVVNATGGNIDLAATMYGNSPEAIRKNYYTTNNLDLMRDALNNRKIV